MKEMLNPELIGESVWNTYRSMAYLIREGSGGLRRRERILAALKKRDEREGFTSSETRRKRTEAAKRVGWRQAEGEARAKARAAREKEGEAASETS